MNMKHSAIILIIVSIISIVSCNRQIVPSETSSTYKIIDGSGYRPAITDSTKSITYGSGNVQFFEGTGWSTATPAVWKPLRLSSLSLRATPDSARTWTTIDTLSNSNITCQHSWVFDTSYDPQPGISCLVYHPDGHCSWHDRRRKAICELCKLHILQQELYTPPPVQPTSKSKYQQIIEGLSKN